MPKYKVTAHHRVQKFLTSLNDKNLKQTIIDHIAKLEGYPLTLREMDVEKIRGMEKTFRIKTRKFRIIFNVNNTEKEIYVTHIEARKKAYTNL